MSSKFCACRCGTKIRQRNNKGKRHGNHFAAGHNQLNGRAWRSDSKGVKNGTPTTRRNDAPVNAPSVVVEKKLVPVKSAFKPRVDNWCQLGESQ